MSPPTLSVADLLEHAGWMRRLARALTGEADADDVVQEAWVAAATHPPRADAPARPWLAEVVRNFARMHARGRARRAAREATVAAPDAQPSSEDLLGKMQAQRLVAGLVMELDEPFRSTVLLRYYEELTAVEIARRQGIEAGTVRWRLAIAVQRLRARLDERHVGGRRAWMVALAPVGKGALLVKTKAGIVAGVALLLLTGAGTVWWAKNGPAPRGAEATAPPGADTPPPAAATAPAVGEPSTRSGPSSGTSDGGAVSPRAARAAAALRALVPAVASATEQRARPLGREEAVDACVANRERVLACKDAFAEAYVAAALPDPDVRGVFMKHVHAEMERDGAGPAEDRRRLCEKATDARVRPTAGDLADLDDCFAMADCAAQAACAVPILKRLKAPAPR